MARRAGENPLESSTAQGGRDSTTGRGPVRIITGWIQLFWVMRRHWKV